MHNQQRLNVAQAAKEAGQVYHNLKPEEREVRAPCCTAVVIHDRQMLTPVDLQRLKLRAQAAKEERERELAVWKSKLTPEDIRRENLYRAAQRKLGKSRRGNLKDPNAPRKPLSAYFMFLQKASRYSSLLSPFANCRLTVTLHRYGPRRSLSRTSCTCAPEGKQDL